MLTTFDELLPRWTRRSHYFQRRLNTSLMQSALRWRQRNVAEVDACVADNSW